MTSTTRPEAFLVDGTRTPFAQETGDPADLPSRSLRTLYERGDLGRKTGRGWYVYDEAGAKLRAGDVL